MGLESMTELPRPTRAEASDVAKAVLDYGSLYLTIRGGVLAKQKFVDPVESICSAAVKACIDSDASLILALTETGHTARLIAKYRPKATILAISASETTIRQLLCVRGVVPMLTASFV